MVSSVVCSVVSSVPADISAQLAFPPVVGFSGSRSFVPAACAEVVPLVCAPVIVGCARGVDEFFRGAFPAASVFRASCFGSGRGSFAARSVAFVSALHRAGGVLVSFPSGRVPVGLVPSASASRCFSGFGSGSWASLAFAVGLGVECFVFSPASVGCGRLASWGFRECGGGWFALRPHAVQLSLF